MSPAFLLHSIPGERLKSQLWAPSRGVLYLPAMAHILVLFVGVRGDQVSPRYHKGTWLGHPSVSQNWEVFLEQI